MRLISFSHTEPQLVARTKTVTRRKGWRFLREGELLQPVDRVRGPWRGRKPKKICGPIRVTSIRRERLDAITAADCTLEGFPDLSPAQFIEMFAAEMKCKPEVEVARIEFEFVDQPKLKRLVGKDVEESPQ